MVEDLGELMVNGAGDVNWVQVCPRLNVQTLLVSAAAAAAGPRQTPLKLAQSSESLATAMNNERHNRVNASNVGFKAAMGSRAACARARD